MLKDQYRELLESKEKKKNFGVKRKSTKEQFIQTTPSYVKHFLKSKNGKNYDLRKEIKEFKSKSATFARKEASEVKLSSMNRQRSGTFGGYNTQFTFRIIKGQGDKNGDVSKQSRLGG